MGEKAEILRIRLVDYLSSFSKLKIFIREKHCLEDSFFAGDKTYSIVSTYDYHIHNTLKSYANKIIDKTRYNALFKTELDFNLVKNKVKHIGIVGLETHTSVLFTAEDLRNRDYQVTVIEPCTMSRDDYLHGCALTIMKQYLSVRISNG